MNNDKIGFCLIILGNILYLSYIFFCNNETSIIGDFSSGILLGLSIGINLVGVIFLAIHLSNKGKK